MAPSEEVVYWVVEFEKVCGVSTMEVVPSNWQDIEGNRCILYPDHYSTDKAERAAKRAEPPTDTWRSFPVKKVWYQTCKCSFILQVYLNCS